MNRWNLVLMVVVVFCMSAQMGWSKKREGRADDPVERIGLLPPRANNPQNKPGDFVSLSSGRIMFVYTHYYDSRRKHAYLAARYSSDGGRTWTSEDVKVVPNHAERAVESASLLRLHDGRIALFYLARGAKVGGGPPDTRPLMRLSTDEGKTWSKPKQIVPDSEIGYYVKNNGRGIQLKSGRLVLPLSRHYGPSWQKEKFTQYGKQMCYLSDNAGESWHRSKSVLTGERSPGKPTGTIKNRILLQEPGVVELRDGRLMMYCRTRQGYQYVSYSEDQGETWPAMQPLTALPSPTSPATIERVPATGDLLVVWNNHESKPGLGEQARTPLTVAISRDEGLTWENEKNLYEGKGKYCYVAIHFVDDHVLLGHFARTQRQVNITRFPVDWLYR